MFTNNNNNNNDIAVTIGTQAAANASKSAAVVNESSNSVPMAQLVMKSSFESNKQQQQMLMQLTTDKNHHTASKKQQKTDNFLQQSQTQNSATEASINFVFSPAGPNSFLNTFKNISSSASKISSLKQTTPTNAATVEQKFRSSPRSLKQNSKRKLDLNALLDQMPDKDFVEIEQKTGATSNCNLMNKFEQGVANVAANAKADEAGSPASGRKNKFKKPLTEHQKEVRKQKSFLPMEIQQVCNGLEPNMDSQMSCTNDYEDSMQSQSFIMPPSSHEQTAASSMKSRQSLPSCVAFKSLNQFSAGNNKTLAPNTHLNDENANDKMDMDKDDDYLLANMDITQSEKRQSTVAMAAPLSPPLPVQAPTANASLGLF